MKRGENIMITQKKLISQYFVSTNGKQYRKTVE